MDEDKIDRKDWIDCKDWKVIPGYMDISLTPQDFEDAFKLAFYNIEYTVKA